MSRGHYHQGGAGTTQNQGNQLGDRPCVRQSRLYREHVGGNTMKELMGQDQLKWDTNRTEGAYQGGRVFDHNSHTYERAEPGQQRQPHPAYAGQQQQQQQQQQFQQQQPQYHHAQPQQQPQQYQQQQQPVSQAPWATSEQQPPQQQQHQQQQQQQGSQAPWATSANEQQAANPGHRKGAGQANKQSYNLLTGGN